MDNCYCLGFSINPDCPVHGQPTRKKYQDKIAHLNNVLNYWKKRTEKAERQLNIARRELQEINKEKK